MKPGARAFGDGKPESKAYSESQKSEAGESIEEVKSRLIAHDIVLRYKCPSIMQRRQPQAPVL